MRAQGLAKREGALHEAASCAEIQGVRSERRLQSEAPRQGRSVVQATAARTGLAQHPPLKTGSRVGPCSPFEANGVIPAQPGGRQPNSGPAHGGAQARGQPERGAGLGRPPGRLGGRQGSTGASPTLARAALPRFGSRRRRRLLPRRRPRVAAPVAPFATPRCCSMTRCRCRSTPSWTSAAPTPTSTPTLPSSLPAARACPSRWGRPAAARARLLPPRTAFLLQHGSGAVLSELRSRDAAAVSESALHSGTCTACSSPCLGNRCARRRACC